MRFQTLPERHIHEPDSTRRVFEGPPDGRLHELDSESDRRRPQSNLFTLFPTNSPPVPCGDQRIEEANSRTPVCPSNPSSSLSFDDFLFTGYSPRDFQWNIDEARSLSPLDIRNWREILGSDSSIANLDSKVIERRTNVWKIVLSQEPLPADTSDTSPFRIPLNPGSPLCHHTLRPGSVSPSALTPFQRVHISPFAIPSTLADIRPSSAPEMLAHLNAIFGTEVTFTSDLQREFLGFVRPEWDVGVAYSRLRPWWDRFAAGRCTFQEMGKLMCHSLQEKVQCRTGP